MNCSVYILAKDEPPSEGIIQDGGLPRGPDSTALDPAISTAVDSDALDLLYTPAKTDGEIPVSVIPVLTILLNIPPPLPCRTFQLSA